MSEPVSDRPVGRRILDTPDYGTEEWAEERFPDRGAPPSNEVVLDPDAPQAPNVGEHG